jgi:hypothetical protein
VNRTKRAFAMIGYDANFVDLQLHKEEGDAMDEGAWDTNDVRGWINVKTLRDLTYADGMLNHSAEEERGQASLAATPRSL